jgi:hypothetical protein
MHLLLSNPDHIYFSKWLTGIYGWNSLNPQLLYQGQPERESLTYLGMLCDTSDGPRTIPSNIYNKVFSRFSLSVVKHQNEYFY